MSLQELDTLVNIVGVVVFGFMGIFIISQIFPYNK